MKSYEIVGYILDGAVYCINHKPHDECNVIFAGDEGWEQLSCDECLHTLECPIDFEVECGQCRKINGGMD